MRYAIALLCLVTTIVLITYKLTADQKLQAGSETTTDVGTSNTIAPTNYNATAPTGWTDLSTTISSLPATNSRSVMQGPNPYLLIDDQYLIPLSTVVYDGIWTGVTKVSNAPLMVYYRYQLSTGKGYTYLYDLTANSSRELDQLIMVGKVGQVYLFSMRESADSYRGLSAIIDGSLTTLYTGDYTTAQYLGDTLKLNNSQTIYLPLSTSGS